MSKFIQTTEFKPRRDPHLKQTYNKWGDWNSNFKKPSDKKQKQSEQQQQQNPQAQIDSK